MKISLTQILFVLVGASLAVLLAVVGYVSLVPSDGQFWSIDPELSPESAAEIAFTDGDFRFLGARVFFKEAKEAEVVYGISGCRNHPLGDGQPKTYANFAELRGADAWGNFDSIRDFADSYNFRLWDLLEERTDTKCWGFDVG